MRSAPVAAKNWTKAAANTYSVYSDLNHLTPVEGRLSDRDAGSARAGPWRLDQGRRASGRGHSPERAHWHLGDFWDGRRALRRAEKRPAQKGFGALSVGGSYTVA